MNESLRMVIVLTVIAIISGGSLALVDNATKAKIEENKLKSLKEGLKKMIPDAADFEKKEVTAGGETFVVYRAFKGDSTVGWGFLFTGSGFQDKISIIVASNPEITSLLGIEVLEQKETPGLGAKIGKEAFKKQFVGLSIEKEIGYMKNRKPEPGSNCIQAISAATISTKRLLKILNNGMEKIKDIEDLKNRLRGN